MKGRDYMASKTFCVDCGWHKEYKSKHACLHSYALSKPQNGIKEVDYSIVTGEPTQLFKNTHCFIAGAWHRTCNDMRIADTGCCRWFSSQKNPKAAKKEEDREYQSAIEFAKSKIR
jgi:uncharacterized protein YodC (DUF2158 family)